MTTRVLPPADVFASCPLDGKILDFYSGTFEAVYVSLHPFLRPRRIDKAAFAPGTYPSQREIAADCEPVSWREVIRLTRLPSLEAVDVGLRTSIHGLRADLQNESYAQALSALFETNGILTPTEGLFSDLLQDSVLGAIQALGYEWLWVGDEFCTERKLHWINDLREKDESLTRGRFNLFTPDKQLLWTVHWDSHFSFLCSSAQKLNEIQQRSRLEGFFCETSTEVYWSVTPRGQNNREPPV